MNGGYCLWLYLVSGTNWIENNGIMRDYDVIRCESYCAISQKKIFFSKFRVKIECNWSYGSNEPRIFKFLGFWWKWGITHSKEALFSVWNKSMRVWPWEVTKIEAFLRHWLSLWGISKFGIGYPVIWYQLCWKQWDHKRLWRHQMWEPLCNM